DVAEITAVAEGVLQQLSDSFYIDNHELYVTASIGISIYPNHSADRELLIKYADIAMYHAKERGGNSYQIYESDINTRPIERLQLENHLRKALERNEFSIYFQPLLDVSSGNIIGVEALIR